MARSATANCERLIASGKLCRSGLEKILKNFKKKQPNTPTLHPSSVSSYQYIDISFRNRDTELSLILIWNC